MGFKYKKETMSYHVGVRMTHMDGERLHRVAAILRLKPSELARKIILDYVHDFDIETDKNVKK